MRNYQTKDDDFMRTKTRTKTPRTPYSGIRGVLSSSLVGLRGLEPLTSRLSVVRSSQLSYRPLLRSHPLRWRTNLWWFDGKKAS